MANKPQKEIIKDTRLLTTRYFTDKLKEHKKVKVVGLGIFELVKYKGRKVKLPHNGEEVKVRSFNNIRFKPTQSIKNKVQ